MKSRVVVFDLPFPLRLRDLQDAGEIVVAGEPPAGVGLLRVSNDRGGWQASGVMEGGDPYGRVAYTRVQVCFQIGTGALIERWSDDELINTAVDRVNTLIDHYRDIAADPLVERLSAPHLVHFWIVEDDGEGETQTRVIGRASGPLILGTNDEAIAIDEEVRRRSLDGAPPSILRMLALDVDARLRRGDGRLAVIEAAAYFESWLQPALERAFLRLGDDSAAVAARFVHANGSPRGVRNLLTSVLPQATNYTFEGTAEFVRWDAARSLRNDLVHGHRLDVDTKTAAGAVQAIGDAVAHLRDQGGLA